MKQTAYWMMAAIAVGLLITGCDKSKADAQKKSESLNSLTPPADLTQAPVAASDVVALPEVDPTELVAKVNGKDITEGDVQKVLSMFMKQMGGRIPPEQMATAIPRIRERIVEELIMRNVMLDAVSQEGISLSDAEFAEVKAELSEELPPGTTLESYMAETGTTEAEMREQMAVRKMIMAKAESLAKPTDEEIQAFYSENKEGFSQGETVTASHILIKVDPTDDDAAKTAKRERLEGLRKQLTEGADFAELAKSNSDCPSASAGGDLGSFGRGQMVPAFEDAAFAQTVGSVGEVVETQFGFHLIKVSEHNTAKTLEFDEVKTRISDILYSQKQQDAVKEYVDSLRSKASIERFGAVPSEETQLQLDVEEEQVVEEVPAIEEVVAVEEVVVEKTPEVVEEVAVSVEVPVVPETAEPPAVEEVKEVTATAAETVVSEVKEVVTETIPAAADKMAEEAKELGEKAATAATAIVQDVQEKLPPSEPVAETPAPTAAE